MATKIEDLTDEKRWEWIKSHWGIMNSNEKIRVIDLLE